MFKIGYKKLVFILYDGLKNSVFISQVLQPLLNQLKEDNNLEITLVSFEKERPSNQFLLKTIPAHERLHLIIARRLPFLGKFSLYFSVLQLRNLFKLIDVDQIVARGPLAAWVAIKAFRALQKDGIVPNSPKNILIRLQARGLCAQEYRFVYQYANESFFKKCFHKFIYYKLNQIETESYQIQSKNNLNSYVNIKIEAVSPALKDYLVENFKIVPAKIAIAHKDLPQKINIEKKELWKKEVRAELGIAFDDFVYCYSGSAKPWQCVSEAIQYFYEQFKNNPKSFLLILSPDSFLIQDLLLKYQIPLNRYLLLSVDPKKLERYLCACDAGLLFRDKDIINWVSRPTKMLEYQAAGLQVIHNHTIGWLER